jgi:hypothetical protein
MTRSHPLGPRSVLRRSMDKVNVVSTYLPFALQAGAHRAFLTFQFTEEFFEPTNTGELFKKNINEIIMFHRFWSVKLLHICRLLAFSSHHRKSCLKPGQFLWPIDPGITVIIITILIT